MQRSAAVGAMIAMSRQLGQTLGAALAGVLFALHGATAAALCFEVAALVSLAAAGLSLMRARHSP